MWLLVSRVPSARGPGKKWRWLAPPPPSTVHTLVHQPSVAHVHMGQCSLPSPPPPGSTGTWPLFVGCGLEGGDVHVTDLEEVEEEEDRRERGEPVHTAPLVPPSSLFDAPAYPPLHIFVSSGRYRGFEAACVTSCHLSLCTHRCLVGVSRLPLPLPHTPRVGCSVTSSPFSAIQVTRPSYKRQ